MRRRDLGVERKACNLGDMIRVRASVWLICCCLLLALSGCGNKGPLVPPEEEEEKKAKSVGS